MKSIFRPPHRWLARLGVLALACLLAACHRSEPMAPAGAPQPKPLVFGVSLLNLSSEFIVMLNQAMQAKAKELGVQLLVQDAQRAAEKQVQQVENFVAQKVDAVILNPCEVEASSPAVSKALASG